MYTLLKVTSTSLQLINAIKLFLAIILLIGYSCKEFLPDIYFAIDSLQSFKNKLYSLDLTKSLCGRL